MAPNWIRIVAMACAGFAVVATVVGWVMKYREIKTLREIRDRLDQPR
jgi:hypothetical protein